MHHVSNVFRFSSTVCLGSLLEGHLCCYQGLGLTNT